MALKTAGLVLVGVGCAVALPLTGPLIDGPCDVSGPDRKDCGYSGIDQSGCEAKGCCWVPAGDANDTPWCFYKSSPTPPTPTPPPTPPAPTPLPTEARTAFVHLFEWKWSDIAQECEDFLGPMGFNAVQTSPQMEHIQGDAWWTRYQPVSYKTVSRSGDEAAFKDMVNRCKAVGVGIIADPVPNHMASGSGTGIAGSSFGGRAFSAAGYGAQDMHHNDNDQSSNCQVSNYNDKFNVQHCDLVGLTDLDTGADYVQGHLADYFKSLLSMGVSGLRIDAAKHQDDNEIAAYLGKAGNPWVFQEVIGAAGEAVQPSSYLHNGHVTEFNFPDKLGNTFKNGNLQDLSNFGEGWGLVSSGSAVTFMDNHDTQRGNAVLTYKNGDLYRIANYFMLAHPYGYPKVMSSYYFNDHDQGPPGQNVHDGGLNCFSGKPWVCEHRWTGVGEMVGFRNYADGQPVANFHGEGNKISFSRGNKAFIALNQGGDTWSTKQQTGMAAGDYCDVIQGLNPCKVVTVGSDGMASVNVPGTGAVAIHGGARPSQQLVRPDSGAIFAEL